MDSKASDAKHSITARLHTLFQVAIIHLIVSIVYYVFIASC